VSGSRTGKEGQAGRPVQSHGWTDALLDPSPVAFRLFAVFPCVRLCLGSVKRDKKKYRSIFWFYLINSVQSLTN
jgi:hypothetical protein